jgi:SAM-dependent methyltransferase
MQEGNTVAFHNSEALLEETRKFWNTNPCDSHSDLLERMNFRYGKEPYLPKILQRAAINKKILEVGCGQGTDALFCGRIMPKDGIYIGIDYSDKSIRKAEQSAKKITSELKVQPRFECGNAESLSFPEESFNCVISMGVIHHTPHPAKAIEEIFRVLKQEGEFYIFLYRRFSPKVIGAYILRLTAYCIDLICFKPGLTLNLIRKINPENVLGTMIIEALGVPILKSYTRRQIYRLMCSFSSVKVSSVGIGFKLFGLGRLIDKLTNNMFGAMWLIEGKK